MYKKTFTDLIYFSKLLIEGIKKNIERLSKRGITDEFAQKIESTIKEAEKLDQEQEFLKAELKKKTDELNKKMKDLKKLTSESKKTIKIEFTQIEWKDFGITDKK